MVQSFQGQAGIALREMDRDIIRATKGLVGGHPSGDRETWKYARKLRKVVPERSMSASPFLKVKLKTDPDQRHS